MNCLTIFELVCNTRIYIHKCKKSFYYRRPSPVLRRWICRSRTCASSNRCCSAGCRMRMPPWVNLEALRGKWAAMVPTGHMVPIRPASKYRSRHQPGGFHIQRTLDRMDHIPAACNSIRPRLGHSLGLLWHLDIGLQPWLGRPLLLCRRTWRRHKRLDRRYFRVC